MNYYTGFFHDHQHRFPFKFRAKAKKGTQRKLLNSEATVIKFTNMIAHWSVVDNSDQSVIFPKGIQLPYPRNRSNQKDGRKLRSVRRSELWAPVFKPQIL